MSLKRKRQDLVKTTCYFYALQLKLKQLALIHDDLLSIIAGYCLEVGRHLSELMSMEVTQKTVVDKSVDDVEVIPGRNGHYLCVAGGSPSSPVVELFDWQSGRALCKPLCLDPLGGRLRILVNEKRGKILISTRDMLTMVNSKTLEVESSTSAVPSLKAICDQSNIAYDIILADDREYKLLCYKIDPFVHLVATHNISSMMECMNFMYPTHVSMDQLTHRLLLSNLRGDKHLVIQMDPADVAVCRLHAIVSYNFKNANHWVMSSALLNNQVVTVTAEGSSYNDRLNVYTMVPTTGNCYELEQVFQWETENHITAAINYSTGEVVVLLLHKRAYVCVLDME